MINFLQPSFSSLIFLTEVDLSKNNILSLPENFGDLQKLQKLDLYGNALTTLPFSISKLTRLRWLDLRDNPLCEDIAKAAGDCSNEAECKDCAKKVSHCPVYSRYNNNCVILPYFILSILIIIFGTQESILLPQVLSVRAELLFFAGRFYV